MNEHIAKQFDIDLTNIHTKVLQMGGLVEKQIVDAMAALEHGDLAGGPQAVGAKSRDEQERGGEAGEAAEDPGRARG